MFRFQWQENTCKLPTSAWTVSASSGLKSGFADALCTKRSDCFGMLQWLLEVCFRRNSMPQGLLQGSVLKYVLGQVWHCLHCCSGLSVQLFCCSGLSVQLFRVQSTLAAKKNQVVQPGATFTINFVNYTMMVLTLIQDQLWRPVCKVSRKMFISLTGVVMPALAQFRWLAWHATSMD